MKLVGVLLLLFLGLLACDSMTKKTKGRSIKYLSNINSILTISQEKTKVSIAEIKKQKQEFRSSEICDSLHNIKMLQFGLYLANKNLSKNSFTYRSDSLNIDYGYIFSKSSKHLIIQRIQSFGVYSDIYKLFDEKFQLIVSEEMATLAFIGDSIADVNGDGLLDYLFHWYPMSGCCSRDIYDVHLQKENGDFSRKLTFINPIFSPKQKIVRGKCYGQNPALYKYKWRGNKIDTIEYIFFDMKRNQYVKRNHDDENEKGQILDALPNEYKNVQFL